MRAAAGAEGPASSWASRKAAHPSSPPPPVVRLAGRGTLPLAPWREGAVRSCWQPLGLHGFVHSH